MKKFRLLASAGLVAAGACAAGLAAASPVAVSISPGFKLSAYTGSTALYGGRLDIDNTLFFLREASIGGVQAWTLFFDPARNQTVSAVLDFGAPVVDVFSRAADLNSSALTYGIDINRDGLANDYLFQGASGLEGNDSLSWAAGSSQMSLKWTASDPGDHVRVLVRDVPEPGTAALAVLALVVVGALGSRRQRQ